jgi:type IV/VI secretion system ImpK/VasF family protein
MANALAKPKSKKKKRKSSSTAKKNENAFNGIVSLIGISEAQTPNTQLLLTKPPIHQSEAGLNPLVDAAAYVFLLMGQLSRTRSHQDVSKLHEAIMEEVKNFQNSVYLSNYSPETLAEYVPISSYILCTMLDDVLASTPWGSEGKWTEFSVLHSHDQEILSRESFLIILERFIQEPNTYIDIMEFTYVCLTLGFKYSCHSSGFDAEQLQKILHSLYKRIRAHRGNISRQLSPNPIKYNPPAYYKENWKSRINHKLSRLFKKPPHSSTFLTTCPTLMEHIINLETRFQKAVHFLSTRSVKMKGEKVRLSSLPWLLFIGSAHSGKSTLIENSNIKFIANNKADEDTERTMLGPKNWHWWVTPESVMIDVGSDYLAVSNTDKALTNKPWEFLLDLMMEERGPEGLRGVTLVMSYSEIMDNVHQYQLIEDLSQRIHDLTAKFGRDLPFNLVITKCDLIPGFMDFFSDFTNEELYQAWGATLPHPTAEQSLGELMNSRFNQMIKRLNNQLIYRLNQEKDFNFQSKISIQGFPLQVEQLKEELLKIIKGLVKRDHHFTLNGFYLTSATQTEVKEDTNNLPQVISSDKFLQSLKIMKAPAASVQSYFVKQLLLHGLISETNSVRMQNYTSNLLQKI